MLDTRIFIVFFVYCCLWLS